MIVFHFVRNDDEFRFHSVTENYVKNVVAVFVGVLVGRCDLNFDFLAANYTFNEVGVVFLTVTFKSFSFNHNVVSHYISPP